MHGCNASFHWHKGSCAAYCVAEKVGATFGCATCFRAGEIPAALRWWVSAPRSWRSRPRCLAGCWSQSSWPGRPSSTSGCTGAPLGWQPRRPPRSQCATSISGSWADSYSSPVSQQSGCRPRRVTSTCTLTRSCSLIAVSSQTSSATTRSSASRSSSTGSSQTPAGSLYPGGLGQARPRQGQSPSRPAERPGAQAQHHPPSPADSSRRSASVMETAHLVPATSKWLTAG